MKLFEYQAKEIFRKYGIPVPKGVVIDDISQLGAAVEETGCPCMLKSQVLMGGRGRSGLIQSAQTKDAASGKAAALFKSHHRVGKILVEQAVDIRQEIYLSVTVDPVDSKALIIASVEGGIEIEKIAAEAPDKLIMEKVDTDRGLMDFQMKNIVYSLGVCQECIKPVMQAIANIYEIFCKYDAELVEINPLFITKEGLVIAGDGKLSIDDNSMFRQLEYRKTRDYFDTEVEYEADMEGIPYLQFDGDISLMCAGAGLTTAVYDLIIDAGGTVANYLEFGGPNYRKAVRAMELCLQNRSEVILVVTFGTIARADVMAEGIVEAISRLKPDRPVITCIRGTNEEKAFEILHSAGLECISDTEEAVQKAIELAARRKGQ